MASQEMKIVVVGGAGAMGRITVRDLLETAATGLSGVLGQGKVHIVVADLHEAKARALVQEYEALKGTLPAKSKGGASSVVLSAVGVDVKDHERAKDVWRGADVVINCAQYQLNLDVMEVALSLSAHYIDIGGLFHMTRRQLELHERFKRKGRLALLGMGAAPGVTNLLAARAATDLDDVLEIHTRVAGVDRSRYTWTPALGVSYSLKTILEEFSHKPALFTGGEFCFVEPMSGRTPMKFPSPVGIQKPMYTLHSEVATLPLSYADKGVREVSFKIAFDPEFLDRVQFLRDLGMADGEPRSFPGGQVSPIDMVNAVAMSQRPPERKGPLKQVEIVRAVVKGRRRGKKLTVVADCRTPGIPEWDLGIDADTGCPPSVAAQMILRGEITATGVLPPELCVPVDGFFKELKKRHMTLKVSSQTGWSLKV